MEPYIHQIQYYETDKMQITHHSNYVRFMEEARIDFLKQIGWGYDRMEEEGIISPVTGISCDYKRTTTFPDVIRIEIQVLSFNGIRLQLGYTMTCEGNVVCTAQSEHCFLDVNGRPINMKRQFPEFYKQMNR
ncbi:MAG: thioesterase family protein [Lachnospiraceae bacterium]|nr:thioesterase family protein [Lachnospiraceae bacterium]